MSTLNVTKQVQRSDLLYAYVQNTFPTLTDCSTDGTVLRFTFSDNQTANLSTLQTLLANYVDPLLDTRDLSSTLSIFNSSSANLAANAVFTGGWEDISVYATVQLLILASSGGSAVLQFGVLSKQADSSKTYAVTGATLLNVLLQKQGRYFRIVYTNGSTAAQTANSIATYLIVGTVSTNSLPPVGNLNDVLVDSSTAALTRSVDTARYGIQQYGTLRMNEQSELKVTVPNTLQRTLTGINYPVAQVSYVYNINSDQNTTATTGSGSVVWNSGRAVVNSSAAASSSATLSTYRYVRCSPGDSVSIIFSCAFSTPAAGNTQICGAGTSSNGLFLGYNGTTFGLMVRSAGIDTWTAASSFNSDPVNGTGKSGVTLNPFVGNDFSIQYDTLGYGTVVFMMIVPRGAITMHTISFSSTTAIGIQNPQFPCSAASINTSNTTNVPISVAAFSIFNDAYPQPKWLLQRSVDVTKTLASTTNQPLIVLYNKPTYNGQTSTCTLQLVAVAMNTLFTGLSLSHNNATVTLSVIEFPTLTGGTYTDFNTNNSILQTSTNATAVSGGNVLFQMCIQDGSGAAELTRQDIVLSPGYSICLAAKLSSSSNYTVSLVVCISEFQ